MSDSTSDLGLRAGWSLNKPSRDLGQGLSPLVYCSVFLYRVPKRKAEAFTQALKPIMKLFLDSGALSEELLQPREMEGKFGSMSLPPAIGMADDEELFVEIARFTDASHMREVHSAVAKNPHLEKLHSRFDLLITGKQVYHAEFESIQQK